uniref:Vav 3 guanine nucleotide exchange factor b n=1 Tax=Anabas testudineus TaxID=64144 RepID=A0A7N6A3P1_ANATE
MEYWRQCAMWLISCNVLPANHRVTADAAQVFDLAQTLRDGVLLCQLLNNLRPHTINLKEINLRPQMSQFLCLKNIRTFLISCSEVFGMKKSDLFEAFDLFDVRDFGKVTPSSIVSFTKTNLIQHFLLNSCDVCINNSLYKDMQKITSVNNQNLSLLIDALLIMHASTCSVHCFLPCLALVSVTTCMWLHLLQECSKRANNGKFTLRDLLVVPMQRVLKYHLLLQELVKHTHDAADKSNLKIALDAMKDLAQYVNEVKRDNETLREIDQYQRSIENLNQPLKTFGRPKGDGEVRMISSVDKRKQDRHIFLFDVAVIICKRRGDNYEMKDVLDLNYFKITNNPTSDKEGKKWCYGFYVTHQQGYVGFELFFKTRELKKKWMEQFEMAISNIRPEKANHNSHQFKMHTFEKITSCNLCQFLLRGIFNQGYLCLKCGLGAHKECLGRLGMSKISVNSLLGLPRMVVIRDYSGIPRPQSGPPLSIHAGDVIELMFADVNSSWWQGKILATSKIGFFPSDAVRPCPFVHGWFRFAGPMERYQAELQLLDRGNSTYLVRHRSKECTEYAISIKFNDKVKHIKILTKDGCFYIAESRLFKTVLDLVEYYKQHSLKEGFSSLDTTLQVPYRELSNGNMPRAITRAGSGESSQTFAFTFPPGGCSFVPPSSSPFWSVFSPRVVGVAVARYDFCSRDTRELSLLQGDIIRIYTKISSGWWKGEVDGRVGWFPSTYVEEED